MEKLNVIREKQRTHILTTANEILTNPEFIMEMRSKGANAEKAILDAVAQVLASFVLDGLEKVESNEIESVVFQGGLQIFFDDCLTVCQTHYEIDPTVAAGFITEVLNKMGIQCETFDGSELEKNNLSTANMDESMKEDLAMLLIKLIETAHEEYDKKGFGGDMQQKVIAIGMKSITVLNSLSKETKIEGAMDLLKFIYPQYVAKHFKMELGIEEMNHIHEMTMERAAARTMGAESPKTPNLSKLNVNKYIEKYR